MNHVLHFCFYSISIHSLIEFVIVIAVNDFTNKRNDAKNIINLNKK